MMTTLNKLGMAINNAWIPVLRPLFLLIILKGLSTLKSLNIFTIFNFLLVIAKDTIDNTTTEKSIKFQPFLRYDTFLFDNKP